MATALQTPAQIEGVAMARYIRVSPQKARLVVDLIRGQRAEDALQTLRFTKKRVAKEVEKTLRSAIANAERKAEDSGESLYVGALFANRSFVHEAVKLGGQLKDKWQSEGVSTIDVERAGNKLVVRIYTARPGIIIGRKGSEIDKLKQEVQKRTKREVPIDIQEVHRPELDAQLVAESIALQLEKRVAFRRAMRKAVDSALRLGPQGAKERVAGRQT